MSLSFRKADLLFLVLAIGVVGGVALLPSPRDRNPMVPADTAHRTLADEKMCVTCHQPSGTRPLPAKHPKRPDCFQCHARTQT
ncbi:MAG TPA: cytochrome c3 family protein [Nitrospiraceae bacterium]|nr:cytochrome c3 family protein [Nitrospiraceae bacterium]